MLSGATGDRHMPRASQNEPLLNGAGWRRRGPDFIGIGAQKAGTTWLLHQLSQHPDIFAPHTKELHFFNWLDLHQPRSYRGRVRLQSWHGRFYRQEASRSLAALRANPASMRSWALAAYHLGPRSIASYKRVFPRSGARLRGEFTPDYGPVGEDTVRRLSSWFPDVKVLLVLRDPVDRYWSNVLHVLQATGRAPGTMSCEELLSVLDDNAIGDYRSILTTWERHIAPSRLGIFFYDDLARDPVAFYRSVLVFLGVDPSFVPENVGQRRHETRSLGEMPTEVESVVAAELSPLIRWLRGRFPDNEDVARWDCRVSEVLRR